VSRYIVYFHPGDPVPDRLKYVDDATAAPTVTDDAATLGVTVGSLWIDTAAPAVYVCADASTGAAVWVEVSGGDDQTAVEVPFTPAGSIAATDVQAALEELDGDIAALPTSDLSTLLVDLSVSGAVTADRADAATHDLTLTGNATITPDHSAPTAGEAIDLRLLIRQDGTGGHTAAWGGTISWVGGSAPTMPTDPDALLTVGLLSVDDGATWLGYVADQTAPAASGGGIGPLLLASDHSTPIVFDDILQASDGSDFLYSSEP
jgi:hypothetical protein